MHQEGILFLGFKQKMMIERASNNKWTGWRCSMRKHVHVPEDMLIRCPYVWGLDNMHDVLHVLSDRAQKSG